MLAELLSIGETVVFPVSDQVEWRLQSSGQYPHFTLRPGVTTCSQFIREAFSFAMAKVPQECVHEPHLQAFQVFPTSFRLSTWFAFVFPVKLTVLASRHSAAQVRHTREGLVASALEGRSECFLTWFHGKGLVADP